MIQQLLGIYYNSKRYMHNYVCNSTIYNSAIYTIYNLPRHGINLNVHQQMNG